MGMVMLAKESQILWKQICKIHLKGEYAMFRPTLLERIAHKVDVKRFHYSLISNVQN